MAENIHPIFDRFLSRAERENALCQSAKVIWLMGLSGSGKSTIAKALENELFLRGFKCFVLDGDNLRAGINSNLGFSEEDRNENIRRVAEVAKLFLDAGIVVICSFITPYEKQRQIAKQIIGENDFFLVYLNTPLAVCEMRDVKGLYAKAKRNEIAYFTGVNAPFEEPKEAHFVINTANTTIYEANSKLLQSVLPLLKLNASNNLQNEFYNI